jgi:hypothetical protein
MDEQRIQHDPLSKKADAAFRQAAKKVILLAAQTATPVLVWEENRIQEIPESQFKRMLAEAQLVDER